MTTASTSAVIAQTTTAQFDAWVNEVYTNLVTDCGLTQLSALMDTGQMAVPSTTAVPGAGATSAGYYMFVFNDTLSLGPLVTGTALLGLIPGTGYNGGAAGTFTNVAQASGFAVGTGGLFTVVLGAGGVISSITPTTAGTGYQLGDEIVITSTNMVAAGAAGGGGTSGGAFVHKLTAAAAPAILKIEFGSGAAAADPQMWVTMGTSWASNGTLAAATNGAVTTRVAVFSGAAPTSTSTAYTSRYVYNAALGVLGLVFKIGSATGANQSLGGLYCFRTSSNSGAATNNAMCLITNSSSATGLGASTAAGVIQCMSYTANAVYPTLSANSTCIFAIPSNSNSVILNSITTTLENSTVFVFPGVTMDPGFRFSAVLACAFPNDVPLGTTISVAIIGATALTFLSVGYPWGGNGWGDYSAGTNCPLALYLWQ